MGTNYYWHEKQPCETCGHAAEPKHIGKSSMGWHFTLHVYPEDGINTFEDWQKLYSSGGTILDEYGDNVSPENMTDKISDRRRDDPIKDFDFAGNDAQVGYNNMLQHRKSRFCIGHHPTITVDYCVGWFS